MISLNDKRYITDIMIFDIERLISFFRKARKENPLRVIFYDKTGANPRFHSDYTGKLPFMKCL